MRVTSFEARGRYCQEQFDDVKDLIRRRINNTKGKRSTEQIMMYKTLQKPGMNTCDLEGHAVQASLLIFTSLGIICRIFI